ncbi:hypothetical protein DFH09DRAFT_1333263 [Mycena vulgaris]|nr:hypothetical protein DFH09DRAFT_1333263 [Mycena vulgaris]
MACGAGYLCDAVSPAPTSLSPPLNAFDTIANAATRRCAHCGVRRWVPLRWRALRSHTACRTSGVLCATRDTAIQHPAFPPVCTFSGGAVRTLRAAFCPSAAVCAPGVRRLHPFGGRRAHSARGVLSFCGGVRPGRTPSALFRGALCALCARRSVRLRRWGVVRTLRAAFCPSAAVCGPGVRRLHLFGGASYKRAYLYWLPAVPTGSVALHFFNRTTWPDSDLDLYVTRYCASLPVAFLLFLKYKFVPRGGQAADVWDQLRVEYNTAEVYDGRGIFDVLDFRNGDKKIQLIITSTTPMEVILGFHSTPVMNILMHDVGLSLYPRATFLAREALYLRTGGPWPGRSPYKSELGVRTLRSVGDRFTWEIRLPDTPVATTHRSMVRLNSWKLEFDKEAWVKCRVWTHPALGGSYTPQEILTRRWRLQIASTALPASGTLSWTLVYGMTIRVIE